MEIDFNEYKLRCELRGHVDDVRGICVCCEENIATSSRDKTIRFWSLDPSDKRKYTSSKILLGHSSFVGPLAWIPRNEEYPEGRLVSGSMDTFVFVWDVKNGERIQTLKGHQLQVTGLALDNGDIVSSSVDCTLRRWRNGQQVETWEAHKSAIQTVIKLSSGELVSGSSDTTLKLWKGKTCSQTFAGHTDTVRGLAEMRDLGVLSASHDGSVRLWALSGEVLMEMVGHSSIVYSVDSHASGLIVSGSEDCHAKIWKDGACVQSLEHPGCVWDAKFLENGDIVTACSDGVVRVWTVRHDMIADQVEIDAYASQLSQYKLSRKRVGGLKLDELPGLDSLRLPGTSDGQTKIVREGDNGVAYAWNLKEQRWDKIGEVVDGPDGADRPIFDGVQYDYVFDVDIGDGEPTRKLPYNRSDNPYDAADRWLLKENLPLSFRQQIVEFILQNTGQKDFNFNPSFSDPFTGANAYVPGQTSFTSATPAKPSYKHIPKKGVLVFDVAQYDGILKKITEFNNSLQSDPVNTDKSMTEVEISRVVAVVKILKDTSHYHSSNFEDMDIALLLKLLQKWPPAMMFPAIDLVRMIVLHPHGASLLIKHAENNDLLLGTIKKVTEDPVLPANLLTCVRVIVNLFKNLSFHNWLQGHHSQILDAFANCYSSPNRNLLLAYSTLLLNYAVLLIEKKDEEGQAQVLSAAMQIVEEEAADADSKFRALVAIGSLMLEGLVKKIALDFDVGNIAKAAKASKETKIAEVGSDIDSLIRQ
ncbi:PREDICTED: phospholipase A-2-activating protein [Tarenaya hassleriana]|uniref:phospholipase A-2-activating protein n=1 Tax=Tarenaya hassleriana TaxID=28532 RepID=UPI00053C70A4|nr:PREDICTED: phospholipase A-2-activating protein [Tarenaya hassleriana]